MGLEGLTLNPKFRLYGFRAQGRNGIAKALRRPIGHCRFHECERCETPCALCAASIPPVVKSPKPRLHYGSAGVEDSGLRGLRLRV